MQARHLQIRLAAFGEFLSREGCHCQADELRQISLALEAAGSVTVSKLVQKVCLEWRASDRLAVHPPALRRLLENVQRTEVALDPKSKAGVALSILLQLFTGAERHDVGGFLQEMQDAFNAPKRKTSRKEKLKVVDPVAVRALADSLIGASGDSPTFDKLVAELEGPHFQKAQVAAIANHYLGYASKYDSKRKAIEAIRRRQLRDSIHTSGVRAIDKIGV